jgi:hypothetical protein
VKRRGGVIDEGLYKHTSFFQGGHKLTDVVAWAEIGEYTDDRAGEQERQHRTGNQKAGADEPPEVSGADISTDEITTAAAGSSTGGNKRGRASTKG